MSLPTRDDCLNLLKISKNAIADVRGDEWFWLIGGVEYPERQALKLAEYCLITGQMLTSIATIEGMLNIARRIAITEEKNRDLDNRVDLLKDEIDRLMVTRHWHWWRHG